MHVSTTLAHPGGAHRTPATFNTEFAERVASSMRTARCTAAAPTGEFLGRNGTSTTRRLPRMRRPVRPRRRRPRPLRRPSRSKVDSARPAPSGCSRLGVGHDSADADRLVARVRGSAAARQALDDVHAYWQRTLGAVQIDTPDPAVNVLANGWLHQTLACRLWARSGYYQSGGAFGFRDPLQDAMALDPRRTALLRATCCCAPAASSARATCSTGGTRPRAVACTRCSDDYLAAPGGVPLRHRQRRHRRVLDERCSPSSKAVRPPRSRRL